MSRCMCPQNNSTPGTATLWDTVSKGIGRNRHRTCQNTQEQQDSSYLLHGKTPFSEVFSVLICCADCRNWRPLYSVPCSEIGTKVMALISAFEDLLNRTLAAIPGLLGRLEYLSSLKINGHYGHWGLRRVYGEQAAQRAMLDAHKLLLGEVLQTPLEMLVEDFEAACAAQGRETPTYLEELRKKPDLLPDGTLGPATTRHFNSVLSALSALTKAQRSATRPNA